MPNSNNFYSRDPFGIFKVGDSSQSGGGNFENSPKSPVTKVIFVVFLLLGIAAVFYFQDILKKFFFGKSPKKKVSTPEEKAAENTEVEIKEKAEPETESPEEGTGATIVE